MTALPLEAAGHPTLTLFLALHLYRILTLFFLIGWGNDDQFLEGIPSDLIDAGRIDGASEWWIFSRIIIPLSTAPLAALAVFTFLFNWDNFLWPLVVLTSPRSQTLPLVLAGLRSLYWERYDMWAAGSMLTVAPVMLLYAVAQKQFIRGVTMTGLKA